MCGRFVIIPDNLKARFDIWGNVIEVQPNYNAAPSQHLPVVLSDGTHNLLELMEWGLIPHWSKKQQTGYSMINARMETLLEKPTYKHPFKTRRCVVPASGFYEWQKTESGKQPYYITRKDQPILGFAGLYDIWEDPEKEGKVIKSYTIITTKARGIMTQIHERMPVVLQQQYEQDWLNGADEGDLYELLLENQIDLQMHPVSREVNSVYHNEKSLMEPIKI